MHRVHVAEQQNAGAIGCAGYAADQNVADAVLTGNALDAGADRAQQALRVLGDAIDRFRILRRALDRNPGIDGSEQSFGREIAHGERGFRLDGRNDLTA